MVGGEHQQQNGSNINQLVVPVEGIEPPLLAEPDFESGVSTSSTIRAQTLSMETRPKHQPCSA